MSLSVDLYGTAYGNFATDALAQVRRDTYGEDFGQSSWVTGLVSNEELATRSSTGYFEFCPPGVNERLIGQAGFELVRAEEVTENEVEVSRRWHAARQQRAAELIRLEGEETFAGLQRFLATVHRLTGERRLSRFAYLGRKPGE